MRYISNPPDASALMTSARSFGNYDLPSALSDLIDNSIKARARTIQLTCVFNSGKPKVCVLDDGYGMTEEELLSAMRPASTNPSADRTSEDLGRFGWGMKSASFSQCRKLTVVSRKDGKLSGAKWDLNDVDKWRMGVLSQVEIEQQASPDLLSRDGTEVIWDDCDRLSENGELSESEFNALVVHARGKIALTFHMYLSGKVARTKLKVKLNGQTLAAFDPFYRDHPATQELQEEIVRIGTSRIHIQPFILPHYSKLSLNEYDRLGGDEGFIRNQGFYIYRKHRLIINGTWFRLVKHGEMSQLVRIGVDIPTTLDSNWKITVDKSDAQLPTALRGRLRDIVEKLRKRSSRAYRSRGGRLDLANSVPVWSRHAKNGEISYSVNREHPVVAALSARGDAADQAMFDAVLKVIEQGFPAASFGGDATSNPAAIHQTEADPRALLACLEAVIPLMLAEEGGDMASLVRRLRRAEPFSLNWPLAKAFLVEKGWIHEEA